MGKTKKIEPINTDKDGCCSCLKANYYKMGGARGYEDACAVESHSNEICPTIKTIEGFTVIVEPHEQS